MSDSCRKITHTNKATDIIRSYYDFGKRKKSGFGKQKSSTLPNIRMTDCKQTISFKDNMALFGVRKSISTMSEVGQIQDAKETKKENPESRDARSTKRQFEKTNFISNEDAPNEHLPRMLSDYQKLYQIQVTNTKQTRTRSKLQYIKPFSIKPKSNKRFARMFTQTLSPRFNQKLVRLRKIDVLNEIESKFDLDTRIVPTIKLITAMCKSPGNREGCTLHLIDRKLYVVGGRTTNNLHYIQYLDLLKSEWRITVVVGNRRRSFHTSLVYQQNIYIIGGFKQPMQGSKRKLTSELEIVNLKTKGSTRIKLSKQFKRSRHCSVIYEHSILVTGGVGEEGMLGDGIKLCLATKRIAKLKMPEQFQKGLSMHSMCKGRLGVYLLGGIAGDKPNNFMYTYHSCSQSFIKHIPYGKPVPPCLSPNTEYIEKIQKIVIYGGLTPGQTQKQIQQIILFDQKENTLTEIKRQFIRIKDQFGFYSAGATTCDAKSLYIFGGKNRVEYNQEMYAIDFDFS